MLDFLLTLRAYVLCIGNRHSQACMWLPVFCQVLLPSHRLCPSGVFNKTLFISCAPLQNAEKCSVIGSDYDFKLLLLHKLSLSVVEKLLLNPCRFLQYEVDGGRRKAKGNERGRKRERRIFSIKASYTTSLRKTSQGQWRRHKPGRHCKDKSVASLLSSLQDVWAKWNQENCGEEICFSAHLLLLLSSDSGVCLNIHLMSAAIIGYWNVKPSRGPECDSGAQ